MTCHSYEYTFPVPLNGTQAAVFRGVVKNAKLTVAWPDWRMDPAVPHQRVSWQLGVLGGRTRLTLRHAGFTRAVDVSDYPFGRQEFVGKIRDVAESIPEHAGTA